MSLIKPPSPLSTRLPAQRLDELDGIAGAFNQLLDALQVQYDNLEAKSQSAQAK